MQRGVACDIGMVKVDTAVRINWSAMEGRRTRKRSRLLSEAVEEVSEQPVKKRARKKQQPPASRGKAKPKESPQAVAPQGRGKTRGGKKLVVSVNLAEHELSVQPEATRGSRAKSEASSNGGGDNRKGLDLKFKAPSFTV